MWGTLSLGDQEQDEHRCPSSDLADCLRLQTWEGCRAPVINEAGPPLPSCRLTWPFKVCALDGTWMC